MRERLFVAFEYDAIDLPPDDLHALMTQLKHSISPVPDTVYAVVGPVADELHGIVTRGRS